MTADEWQAHVTREAAKVMGEWLETRGRLHQPIAALTMADLEAMAANAIARFVVIGSERIKANSDDAEGLALLLLGSAPVPSADAKPAVLDTSSSFAGTTRRPTAARCMPRRRISSRAQEQPHD